MLIVDDVLGEIRTLTASGAITQPHISVIDRAIPCTGSFANLILPVGIANADKHWRQNLQKDNDFAKQPQVVRGGLFHRVHSEDNMHLRVTCKLNF